MDWMKVGTILHTNQSQPTLRKKRYKMKKVCHWGAVLGVTRY